MTTAEVFSDYLGLTPENAPWAWTQKDWCKTCDQFLSRGFVCKSCNSAVFVFKKHKFTATSPLAPEPTPGWMETLVRHKEFVRLEAQHYDGPFVAEYVCSPDIYATHPTHAVARALIAADPTLRAACERASDCENYKENK